MTAAYDRPMPTRERLRELAERLAGHGLQPLIDHGLAIVVSGCPSCRAQDTDPAGLYRPLRAVPRGETVTLLCSACGEEREVRHV